MELEIINDSLDKQKEIQNWAPGSGKVVVLCITLRAQNYFFNLLGAIKGREKEGQGERWVARHKLLDPDKRTFKIWSSIQFQAFFCFWRSNFSVSLIFIKLILHGLLIKRKKQGQGVECLCEEVQSATG